MTDADRARTEQQLADAEGGARRPGMAGEIASTAGLAQRGLSTSERELMLVDRIIVLENKLAELKHKYKMSNEVGAYHTPPPPPAPPQRFQTARDAYSVILRVPVVGNAAHGAVGLVKKARAARRNG